MLLLKTNHPVNKKVRNEVHKLFKKGYEQVSFESLKTLMNKRHTSLRGIELDGIVVAYAIKPIEVNFMQLGSNEDCAFWKFAFEPP